MPEESRGTVAIQRGIDKSSREDLLPFHPSMERSLPLNGSHKVSLWKRISRGGTGGNFRRLHAGGMWDLLLDALFPKHSITGVPGVWITDEERRAMRSFPVRLERTVLQEWGVRLLDRIIAASTYDHSPYLRSALHRFKYGRVRSLGEDLGHLLVAAAPLLIVEPGTVLCPVPLHWLRVVHRGFNQSAILAEVVAHHCGWPLETLLKRRRATGHQAWRGRRERRQAMAMAFHCVGPAPASVILIDDIVTSGTTLDACARALREAGAKQVQALVIAAAQR